MKAEKPRPGDYYESEPEGDRINPNTNRTWKDEYKYALNKWESEQSHPIDENRIEGIALKALQSVLRHGIIEKDGYESTLRSIHEAITALKELSTPPEQEGKYHLGVTEEEIKKNAEARGRKNERKHGLKPSQD